jgi:hypothetical protein
MNQLKELKTSPRKMWALRLPESDLVKLKQCAALANSTQTQMISHLINEYHAQFVIKASPSALAKADSAKTVGGFKNPRRK